MEIKCICTFSKDELVDSLLERTPKNKRNYKIVVSLLGVLSAAMLVLYFFFDPFLYVFSITFFIFLMGILLPRANRKATQKINRGLTTGIRYEYVFKDNSFVTLATSTGTESSTELKYENLDHVLITDRYIKLFTNVSSAFLVKKSDLSESELAELTEVLTPYKKRKKNK